MMRPEAGATVKGRSSFAMCGGAGAKDLFLENIERKSQAHQDEAGGRW
jgi:hypothetical protein